MNWIDTALLVYGSIEGHPARPVIEQELRRGTWGTSVLILEELYHVLTRDYRVPPASAASVAERMFRSPLRCADLQTRQLPLILSDMKDHGLHGADAALLALAREDQGILVSQDQALLRAAEAQGVAVRNPITPMLAVQVARWEAQHLPPRGLPRILGVVEAWIRRHDPSLADRFVLDTARLTRLPA